MAAFTSSDSLLSPRIKLNIRGKHFARQYVSSVVKLIPGSDCRALPVAQPISYKMAISRQPVSLLPLSTPSPDRVFSRMSKFTHCVKVSNKSQIAPLKGVLIIKSLFPYASTALPSPSISTRRGSSDPIYSRPEGSSMAESYARRRTGKGLTTYVLCAVAPHPAVAAD